MPTCLRMRLDGGVDGNEEDTATFHRGFKVEAVKQVAEKGFAVAEVAVRLGVSASARDRRTGAAGAPSTPLLVGARRRT
jgi:transposase-like protein